MGPWIIFVILVLLSAFFSFAETGLTAISKSKIKGMVERKMAGAIFLEVLTRDPARMLSTILLSNNLFNIAASVLSAELITHYFETQTQYSFTTITAITTAIVTFILLTFGEIIPKNFAIHRAETVSLIVAPVVLVMSYVLSPVVFILSGIAKAIAWLLRNNPNEAGMVTPEEIQALVTLGESQGVLEKQEKEMIHSIFEFGDLVVKEVMTPRPDMVAVDMRESIDNVLKTIEVKKHSRIPVYNGKLDNIIGILHVKDLLTRFGSTKRPMLAYENLSSLVRPAHFIPETKNVAQLFQYMRAFKNHIAIAVDEYGTVAGLITMENILEEIVGDIHDEFDKDTDPDPDIFEAGKNIWVVKGTIAIAKINELVGSNIPESSDYDSLAGFVFSLFGTIPTAGDSKKWENLIFKVERVRDRRIMTVRITKA